MLLRVAVVTVALALSGSPIARAQENAAAPARADLAITTTLDQERYEPDSEMGATVTVRNNGSVPARDVRFQTSGDLRLFVSGQQLTALPGPTIEPGGTWTARVVGHQTDPRSATARLRVGVSTGPRYAPDMDPTPRDNEAEDQAVVSQARGSVSGVVYRDANANGRFDGGEGVADRQVSASGGAPSSTLAATTDATGGFSFGGDVPTGSYLVHSFGGDADVIAAAGARFTVTAGGTHDLRLPLVPPVRTHLAATASFDGTAYRAGQPVTARITLTNNGTTTLRGLVAVCHTGAGLITPADPDFTALAPDGSGVTLYRGSSKTFVLTETLPADAVTAGEVSIACEFGNAGRNTTGYSSASARARVDGAFGALGGTAVLRANGRETALANAEVVALDQRTGLAAASAVTDRTGKFSFARLPKGATRVLVLGPHADAATGNAWFTADVVADSTRTVRLVAVAGPAVAKPVVVEDIRVEASFDKQSYHRDEPVTARVKVTNTGVGPAVRAGVSTTHTDTDLDYDRSRWGALLPGESGLPAPALLPGQSHEVTIVGMPSFWSVGGVTRLAGTVHAGGREVSFDLSATITRSTAPLSVRAFTDADGDGALDAGEELVGAQVVADGGSTGGWYDGHTDTTGRFRFDALPVGVYRIHVGASGWVAPFDHVELVDVGNGETTHTVGLVRPLSGLEVSLAFARPSYAPTDRPELAVRITNNTGAPILAHVFCRTMRMIYEVGNGPEWGPLDPTTGAGVPVAPGSTWTGTVSASMPEGAPDHGVVVASCLVGPRERDGAVWAGAPLAGAFTKVPGPTWTTGGTLRLQAGDAVEPMPNTELVLHDAYTGARVAATTSGPDGRFTFVDLPVGHYTPAVAGHHPVQFRSGPLFSAVRGEDYPRDVRVEAAGLHVKGTVR
ncbi:carboxypeptidase regulatory-like domain-containing protein [Saccharothrix yanglingensis]|uniref:Alpha-amylase n=1 Tax=Saccharothrix yanglingensis TaxID=659496 RepID=A0ABU0X713_9PSEU|nr:carboxypeptidase regulatory-like domain-containing protein [Saccharothrix yanglingensis]MDQ2587917.1 hypothetical protein [Saccharothrix yanglingensis]